MNVKVLADALERAASLLRASGAKTQAASIDAVARTVAAAREETVDAFVEQTKAKINAPKLHELTPQEFLDRLNAARSNRGATLDILLSLKSSAFDKAKVIAIAQQLLAGRRSLEFKSKALAVKAIEERIHERMYLDSKDAMNQKVAPW